MVSYSPATIDDAVRNLLRGFLIKAEISAGRIIAGTEPDDIHDLRVASRRARTLLTQVPGVFDRGATKNFIRGFKRIGAVTGTCRDLDVWLETIREQRESSDSFESEDLLSLERLIQGKRDDARIQTEAGVGRPWLIKLLDELRLFLDTCPPDPLSPSSAQSPCNAASAAILNAHQRLLRHGDALTDDPSASAFHRLRIDGKKLRYLLESFGEFFNPQGSIDRIEDLKRLQDLLGGINDRVTQLVALDCLDRSVGYSDPLVRGAVELHRKHLQRSLEAMKSSFPDVFKVFSDGAAVRSFRLLFQQPERC